MASKAIALRLEIRNDGARPVYVGSDTAGPGSNANSRLELYLQRGSQIQGSMLHIAADYGRKLHDDEPFASILSKLWLALPPGAYYGQDIVMDPVAFPQLRIPGRYLIKGEYICGGFYGKGPNNPLAGREKEIALLPYKACEGKIKTNSIWIEVESSKE